jgi:NADPH:quinone reductase
MQPLRFSAFGPVSGLEYVDLHDPVTDATTAVVRVLAGSINPSDVKNVEGKMEHVTVPRVPGRDYSGVILHGPPEWIGAAVWGTRGEIGYIVDGSHPELIAVPVASLRRKPANLSFAEAAAVGTTYLAAWLAVIEYARLEAGEMLVIIGAGAGSAALRGRLAVGAALASSASTVARSRTTPPPVRRSTNFSRPKTRRSRTSCAKRSGVVAQTSFSTRSAASCSSRRCRHLAIAADW